MYIDIHSHICTSIQYMQNAKSAHHGFLLLLLAHQDNPQRSQGWSWIKPWLLKKKNSPCAACCIQGTVWRYIKHNIYLTRHLWFYVLRFFSFQLEGILQDHKKKKTHCKMNIIYQCIFHSIWFSFSSSFFIQFFLTSSSLHYLKFTKFETNKARLKIHSQSSMLQRLKIGFKPANVSISMKERTPWQL